MYESIFNDSLWDSFSTRQKRIPRPPTQTIPSDKMLQLNVALLNTLNSLGQHPNLQFTDPNDEGWRIITLSWPAGDGIPEKIFKFEINIGEAVGCTVACVLERVNVTYGWGERFMGLLYSNIDQLPVDMYLPPGDMPELEDVHMNDQGEVVLVDDPAADPMDMPVLDN